MNMTKALCAHCFKEMQYVEGEIISGEKWYHKNCGKEAILVTRVHET